MLDMRLRRTAFLLTFCLLLAVPSFADPVSKRVEKVLADPDATRAFWGIDVVDLKTGKTIYHLNEDKLFTPASNTKLFTTAAAFALIGPTFRFHTTIETSGVIDKYGRLTGDVVLVGRGDPNLSGRTLPYNLRTERKQPPIRVLEYLADQLVQKGVKFVDGDIVADDSYFAFERFGEGWTQDDLMWEYGAPVSALTINDNVMFVNIMPADRPGEKAFVNIDPFADYYTLDNRILTTPTGTGPRKIYINREPGSKKLTLWGNIPQDDPGASEGLAIDDPADFAAQLFHRLLEKRGIVVYGGERTKHTELANLAVFTATSIANGGGASENSAPKPLVLASYDSDPLGEDLQVINKVSQNLHAELILRLLGREKGNGGTIEGGEEVLRGFLTQAGIDKADYVFNDGSGLSRQNLVSPHALVQLLSYAAQQPWGEAYRASLPVAGVDGSLADRYRDTPLQGRVHAKTGSLEHVNSLSGYVEMENGHTLAFAVMVNNHNATSRRALELIDQIVTAFAADDKDKKKK